MNPFAQIINIVGPMPTESGKGIAGQVGETGLDGLGLNFSEILNGKLAGDVSFLFDNILQSGGENSGDELNGLSAEPLLQSVPDNLRGEFKALLESNPEQIDTAALLELIAGQGNDESVQTNTSDIINQLPKSDIEHLSDFLKKLPTGLSPDNQNIDKTSIGNEVSGSELVGESKDLVIQITNRLLNTQVSNKLNSEIVQVSDKTNIVSDKVIPFVDIDKNLSGLNKIDAAAANIINTAEGALNIKSLKVEGNNSTDTSDNNSGRIELPTKSYLRVVPANIAGGNNNGATFANEDDQLPQNGAEFINIRNINNENVKAANLEALAGSKAESNGTGKPGVVQFTNHTSNSAEFGLTSSSQTTQVETLDNKTDSSQVRFVLPAEINDHSLKNNHTVMIRMEPEHLGPIKMTVSSYNDTVSARLVVESPAAKAAVESNLNHLVDQLGRSGIKIDAFAVSVGNSDVHQEHLKENFAKFAETSGGNNQDLNDISYSEEMTLPNLRTQQYIGASGVNWLA